MVMSSISMTGTGRPRAEIGDGTEIEIVTGIGIDPPRGKIYYETDGVGEARVERETADRGLTERAEIETETGTVTEEIATETSEIGIGRGETVTEIGGIETDRGWTLPGTEPRRGTGEIGIEAGLMVTGIETETETEIGDDTL